MKAGRRSDRCLMTEAYTVLSRELRFVFIFRPQQQHFRLQLYRGHIVKLTNTLIVDEYSIVGSFVRTPAYFICIHLRKCLYGSRCPTPLRETPRVFARLPAIPMADESRTDGAIMMGGRTATVRYELAEDAAGSAGRECLGSGQKQIATDQGDDLGNKVIRRHSKGTGTGTSPPPLPFVFFFIWFPQQEPTTGSLVAVFSDV